jgi:heme exporter protein A
MMLVANNLECIRNEEVIFSGLSFSLAAGEILHIMGSNGSGKSSLLYILAGLLNAQKGEVHWQGQPIHQIRQDYYHQLLYLGHKIGIKAQLTVRENLELAASLGRVVCDSMLEVLARFGLDKLQHALCYRLSAGQKQRVALARLLILHAKLWLLDEPFTSLDRESVVILENILAEHVSCGGSVILASHQELELTQLNVKQLSLEGKLNSF